MNKKMYLCWLQVSLFSVSGEAAPSLIHVGVVMSSCSPLVTLLMGINTIIWLLIQIMSEQTHQTAERKLRSVSPQFKTKIMVLLKAGEDLIICRGMCQNTPALAWVRTRKNVMKG